jgi:hypothetical protein
MCRENTFATSGRDRVFASPFYAKDQLFPASSWVIPRESQTFLYFP